MRVCMICTAHGMLVYSYIVIRMFRAIVVKPV